MQHRCHVGNENRAFTQSLEPGCGFAPATGPVIFAVRHDIVTFGAKGDGKTLCSEAIVVQNCVIEARSAGIRIGWGEGDFRRLLFQNIIILNSNRGIGLFVRAAAFQPGVEALTQRDCTDVVLRDCEWCQAVSIPVLSGTTT